MCKISTTCVHHEHDLFASVSLSLFVCFYTPRLLDLMDIHPSFSGAQIVFGSLTVSDSFTIQMFTPTPANTPSHIEQCTIPIIQTHHESR